MPRLPFLVLLVAALLAPSSLPGEEDSITLEGLDGGRLSEADLQRDATILVVWASWSPRCRDIVSRVNELDRRWSSRARVVTVVFQEEGAEARQFLAGQSLKAPVFLDSSGAFSKKYAVTTLPGLLVFNQGELSFRGKLPANPGPTLEQALP